ncbi:MAG: zinc-dependent alcohol dehydrogenase family protein [Acidimicrobiales bacterium]|nr:zinc-dependent alcohol dehydrogenase family protein [Acidimicrobiales bacterium]
MHALQLLQPGPISTDPLELVERRTPEPRPGEVLIEVSACAVCRTDLQLVEGDLAARRLPIVPGHQVVGIVRQLGEAVGADLGVAEGDRVGIAWIGGACGACEHCRAGRENLCPHAAFTGWDRDGGYAEYVTADARYVHQLPDGFADRHAAPLLCGGAIGYRSLRVAEVQPGQRIGLYGFGASATVAIQVAVAWGCEVYVATRSESERQRALSLGAIWAGSYDEAPPAELHSAITFAPVGSVVVDALRSVGPGGNVTINAIHLDRIPQFPYDLLWMERSIRSVANVTRRDVRELLELAAALPIETQTVDYPLLGAGQALADLADGRVSGAAVLTAAGASG